MVDFLASKSCLAQTPFGSSSVLVSFRSSLLLLRSTVVILVFFLVVSIRIFWHQQ